MYYSEVPNQNKESTTIFKGYKTYPPEHQNASYFPVFKSQGLYPPLAVNSIQILYLQRFTASNSHYLKEESFTKSYSIDIFNKEKSHEKVIASNGCLYFGKWYYLGSPQKLTVVIKMNGDEGKEHQVGNAI